MHPKCDDPAKARPHIAQLLLVAFTILGIIVASRINKVEVRVLTDTPKGFRDRDVYRNVNDGATDSTCHRVGFLDMLVDFLRFDDTLSLDFCSARGESSTPGLSHLRSECGDGGATLCVLSVPSTISASSPDSSALS